MQITEEQIRKIAISHQRQMASVHPHAIIGTIEDAINEALVIAGVMPSLHSIDFKKMRKSKGLTLREVEERTGISNAYLSQLETGKIKSPGYDTVKTLYELYSNEA